MATPELTSPTTTSELLAKFAEDGDQRAFELIVRRHHVMVLGVCQRILGDSHDSEDACQATFAVLAKNARRIKKSRSVASWLHGVAYRVSLKQLKGRLLLKQTALVEPTTDDVSPLEKLARRSDEETVDEELRRMPDKYRSRLVLHYLEDETHQEIGRELGTACRRLPVASAEDVVSSVGSCCVAESRWLASLPWSRGLSSRPPRESWNLRLARPSTHVWRSSEETPPVHWSLTNSHNWRLQK